MFRASVVACGGRHNRSLKQMKWTWRDQQRKRRYGLQHLKALHITYHPFEEDHTSTREYARRVTSKNAWLSNRHLDLKISQTWDKSPPQIKAVFDNNDVFMMDTSLLLEEMVDYFNLIRDRYVALSEVERDFPLSVEDHPFSQAGLEEDARRRK